MSNRTEEERMRAGFWHHRRPTGRERQLALRRGGAHVKGPMVGGHAVFRVGTTGGRLVVFMDSVSLNGKTPSETVMAALRGKNLAEDANKRPEQAAVLDKVESIAVRDGALRIVSRAGKSGAAPAP